MYFVGQKGGTESAYVESVLYFPSFYCTENAMHVFIPDL